MTRKPSAGDDAQLEWFKSSYSSSSEADSCVEVAWRKSSYSDSSAPNDCVEIAPTPRTIHVRDSKNTRGPQLAFANSTWAEFLTYATASAHPA
ncbi:DUF397 domain-containing protein [Streptomyces sp. BA2]|uniref:DUF397 domain-containing protein n=1 Tax=Streptomyces sp. BA2 TaxID=436595 RepID=UPI00132603B6|nr:DUF397 domain-containing protein [Streptomyces sp. BA2]MWA11775.1 DUF397 domain-containing protein [Streptomyces sp. BA2]